MQMNNSAFAIAIVGIFSSIFTCVVNGLLIKKMFKSGRKKPDMTTFFYRFTLDVILGLLVAVYLVFVVLYVLYSEALESFHDLVFYLAFPASNIGAVRSIITLFIPMERNMAAYTPIFYHNFHQYIPTVFIFILALTFGVSEHVVLWGYCEFELNIPIDCAAFGCTINTCFFRYWSTHKLIIFTFTFLFSMLLCIKLFVLNKYGLNPNAELSRVNRIALIDAGNVCFFDFMPSFIANQWSHTQFFSFQNIGPYSAVGKLFGCAIESYLVYRTLVRKKEFRTQESSHPVIQVKKASVTNVQLQ